MSFWVITKYRSFFRNTNEGSVDETEADEHDPWLTVNEH